MTHNTVFLGFEADTNLFSFYIVSRESGYSCPVVIDADVFVAAVYISHQYTWCQKTKQELSRILVW